MANIGDPLEVIEVALPVEDLPPVEAPEEEEAEVPA